MHAKLSAPLDFVVTHNGMMAVLLDFIEGVAGDKLLPSQSDDGVTAMMASLGNTLGQLHLCSQLAEIGEPPLRDISCGQQPPTSFHEIVPRVFTRHQCRCYSLVEHGVFTRQQCRCYSLDSAQSIH